MNLTLKQFMRDFGTETKCLKYIQQTHFPVCHCGKKLYKIRGRRAFACQSGHHVHPLTKTLFARSPIPLFYWFFTLYLMSQVKSGVSARTVQRILGVNYNTAWKMCHKIRGIMHEDIGKLTGEVEVDETYVGGKNWFKGKDWWDNYQDRKKTIVVGLVERGGRVKTVIVPDTTRPTLTKTIKDNVSLDCKLYTDGWYAYSDLRKDGYHHQWVNHGVHYVDKYDPSIHTNGVEGFWGQMKRGITGTYRHVSANRLHNYCDEFTYRHNHRNNIFTSLVERAV